MKLWLKTLLRLMWGIYFVLTSVYCLLAFLPYTYFFLIKAPPYTWMPWFVHHQAGLYWVISAALVATNWRVRESSTGRNWRFLSGIGLLAAAGVYVTIRPFLASLEDNRSAYWWGLASLVPLAFAAVWKQKESAAAENRRADAPFFAYSAGLLAAFAVSAVYALGARIRLYQESRSLSFHFSDAELTLWSVLSHFVLAMIVVSVVNLVLVTAAKSAKPRVVRCALAGGIIFAALWATLYHFLADALSFAGWDSYVYSASLAFGLTLWAFSIVLPVLAWRARSRHASALISDSSFKPFTWIFLAALFAIAIAFPYLIGGADWSGFIESTVTLLIWISVAVCVFRLRRTPVQYSALVLIVVLAGSAAGYKAFVLSEIFWSRPLGSTDDEISMSLEAYGGRDNSFQLANDILGGRRHENCGDLCRILREYTNIRDAKALSDVQLVAQLTPSRQSRPNIFIFVIDSMRPDYLGAYNPRANYTPNLDALASDSIVLHNVYTQYAGTSLSEPAIWTGSMLLHAHYPQPFERFNSLDRMLHIDGYRRMVSWDEVLSAILPSDEGLIKLDTDKKLWNEFELGSTLQQAEAALDARKDLQQPVFFYAQPKNVHQFARNNVPSPTSQHWQSPAGLNSRITYEVHWVDSCLGQFFGYLKQHGMYDNSIIIVTSDHGDATGEFGRTSHSTVLWPEVMRVPLIIHVPQNMRRHLVYDDDRISTLTDITPTIYYLLGHRPILRNPLYGRPLLAETMQELHSYERGNLLLASDARAVYGILTGDGRYFYATYDSPAQSYLFDFKTDYNGEHNILTPEIKQRYDEEIIGQLHMVGDYYGYRPGVSSLLAATARQ